MNITLTDVLQPGKQPDSTSAFYEFAIDKASAAINANARYFGTEAWSEEYLMYCHRDESFKNRWLAALGDYSNKTVLDIGCGPGNIFANFAIKPKKLIGVDVAPAALRMAAAHGYTPVLADAAALPFISAFADIVTLNAALHHCEDMPAVLAEAARLVKPGGLIITDHDPQLSAWDYKGISKLLWNARLILYRATGRGFHKTDSQQYWGLACEIHHKPGRGVTTELFNTVLQPLGFDVQVFPHNHVKGASVLQGDKGKAPWKYRVGNLLSGRNPNADKSALSLMCVARKLI